MVGLVGSLNIVLIIPYLFTLFSFSLHFIPNSIFFYYLDALVFRCFIRGVSGCSG